MPAVKLYVTMMDAQVIRLLVMVVHSVAVDGGREMPDEYVVQHHRIRIVKLMCEENHRRKIVRMKSLDKKKMHSLGLPQHRNFYY